MALGIMHLYFPKLSQQLESLFTLDNKALRAKWCRLYQRSPPIRLQRDLMIRAIGYQLQSQYHGGLPNKQKRRMSSHAQTIGLASERTIESQSSLKSGAILVREWHGDTHRVTVLEDGFEYQGKHHRSLTAIAKQITGTPWSGPRFFGLDRRAQRFVTDKSDHG